MIFFVDILKLEYKYLTQMCFEGTALPYSAPKVQTLWNIPFNAIYYSNWLKWKQAQNSKDGTKKNETVLYKNLVNCVIPTTMSEFRAQHWILSDQTYATYSVKVSICYLQWKGPHMLLPTMKRSPYATYTP